MWNWLKQNVAALVSVASAAILVFLAGMLWASLQLFPAYFVSAAINAARDYSVNGAAYLGFVPLQHLEPRRYPDNGLVTSIPERMAPGVTFMTGLFGNKLGARLYAADGTLLHEWPTDFFKVETDRMKFPFDALLHGDHLYPNGDMVANMDGIGLLRVSACGEIIWQNQVPTHHSISVDDDGIIWTPVYAAEYRDTPLQTGGFRFDKVARIDPDTGKRIDLIDLVAVLVAQDLQGLALGNIVDPSDMMHLNDVEILTAEMAEAFPDFSAGDILLSSRHFSQIWVLDGATHTLKWWIAGPTIGQHDPDFQPDGTITAFDNRPGAPVFRGGSRIVKIDPQTHGVETLYASDESNNFYSGFRGKHEVLENGNILITETDAGRVFEVTPAGEIVWSYLNGWDETRVGWIMSATRYPAEYAAIGEIACPE